MTDALSEAEQTDSFSIATDEAFGASIDGQPSLADERAELRPHLHPQPKQQPPLLKLLVTAVVLAGPYANLYTDPAPLPLRPLPPHPHRPSVPSLPPGVHYSDAAKRETALQAAARAFQSCFYPMPPSAREPPSSALKESGAGNDAGNGKGRGRGKQEEAVLRAGGFDMVPRGVPELMTQVQAGKDNEPGWRGSGGGGG